MSVLEDILGKAVGAAIGGDGDGDKEKIIKLLLPIVVGLLANGGLSKILEKMKGMGLGDEADSWVGTGESKSITGDQASEILGGDQVKDIAGKLGLPEDQVGDLLAKALPLAVDKASPEGNEPAADLVESILKG